MGFISKLHTLFYKLLMSHCFSKIQFFSVLFTLFSIHLPLFAVQIEHYHTGSTMYTMRGEFYTFFFAIFFYEILFDLCLSIAIYIDLLM